MLSEVKDFYDRQFAGRCYGHDPRSGVHPLAAVLSTHLTDLGLLDARCLEIGCGRGSLQDLVQDYTGLDLSDNVRSYLHKPFVQGSATALPFGDSSFDCLWTYAAPEHIHGPEMALAEMRRVLKDGGVLFLAPAWHCRPWAADGISVRSFRELPWRLKIIKAFLPLRNSIAFRGSFILPVRAFRHLGHLLRRQPTTFRYRDIEPNYERVWCADSDAVNHMDPHEAILWFASRGDACLSHPTKFRQLFVRTGCLVFRVCKPIVRSF